MSPAMIEYDKALYIPALDLWLDATRVKDFSFVSHAHTDHATRHRKVLATPPTLMLLEHRRGRTQAVTVPFNQPLILSNHQVTLFPSGHILGSAQILIEGDRRLVYTGDFKLHPGACARPSEVRACDILVMESTFGLPQYVFPPVQETIERLANFIHKTLLEGMTPVVLGYTLGKGQEALKIVGQLGYPAAVHEAIYSIARIYEKLGVEFGPYEKFPVSDLEGKVVVAPTYLRRKRLREHLKRFRTVYLTGWGMDPNRRFALGVDLVLPLSDHADFNELVEYVRQVSPKKVYTVHGFPQFAAHLRNLGFDARHLPERQLELF
jgi:Cft2 family RNA processing exonuclease